MKHLIPLFLLPILLLSYSLIGQVKSNKKMQKNIENLPQNELSVPENKSAIVLAGGCFWCTEAMYLQIKGIISVESGYAGGHIVNPTYEQICDHSMDTGHTEGVKIVYDPKEISLTEVLDAFWQLHDPTTLNRQGNDVGPQYRSEIFYRTALEKETAEASLQKANEELWDGKIVTAITPYSNFYKAEDYHQDFYNRNPNQSYCAYVITPKIKKFQKVFKDKLKAN
jgi:peptide-methionine (S)-S-oxide reductase